MFSWAAALDRTQSSDFREEPPAPPVPEKAAGAASAGQVERLAQAVSAISIAVDPLSKYADVNLKGNNQAICEILSIVSNDLTKVSSLMRENLRAIGCTITALVIEKSVTPDNIQLLVEYFPKVTSLKLNALHLQEMHFSKFSDFAEIRIFGLYNCSIDTRTAGRCFFLLQVFIHMTTLSLENCKGLSKVALEDLCVLSDLHHLTITCSEHVTDEYIEKITTAIMKNLKELCFDKCVNVTDGVIPILAKTYPGLKRLSLAYCPKITDQALIDVSRHFSHIESLNFSGCDQITDAGIFFLIPEDYEQFTEAPRQDVAVRECNLIAALRGMTITPIISGTESLHSREHRVVHLTRLRVVYLQRCAKVTQEYRTFLQRTVRQVCYF